MMKYCQAVFFMLFSVNVWANDSLLISQLLHRIHDLQPKDNAVFPKGSIPSYRLYALNKQRYKADINPFFTGLVGFTLQDIRSELSPVQQQLANTIIENSLLSHEKFRNRKRTVPTYNFWPTDTPQIFPNGGWLNWFDKKYSLPDDMDDTVILLMAARSSDSVAKQVHALMQGFASIDQNKVRNTFPEYRNIHAYSTWFGIKMPVDFDICVLANVLYFVQLYGLEWTYADSASLHFIEKVLEDKKHISAAGYISPHYHKTSIILYHLSRLMALKPIPSLEKLRPMLIDDTQKALSEADSFMEEVILSTSLLRWGVVPPQSKPRKANNLQELVEDEKFSFFIANIAARFPNPWKSWVSSSGLATFYYYSPAYNNMLLLENLIWRKRRNL